ncbi:polymorphic toxin type 46 domain-containing protein [Sphingomonas endolithica]|uniref:polymorphic toxin type 46 domain-containing protein n=1 Tax=Sphingomonas endolithica TaxID=2972485 RepID=UPI0021B01DCB|nr:polymorphic toxin type 46 domain-containing protein [Sphingomonas sp. ZFBP2030]
MTMQPAARVGDDIAHSNAGIGMLRGVLVGAAVGAVLIGATIATGGLALVAAAGAAAGMVSAGGLGGMYIGEASMGPACGKFVTGSPNVFINGRPATFTAGSTASCSKDGGSPIPLATGSSTVFINFGMAGRQTEKIGCSAQSVPQVSPNVFIGGASAQDPRVAIQPEVPAWAVTTLKVLGIAGAVAALPFAVATAGVAATLAIGAASTIGSIGLAIGGRALGEALGLSEANTRALEVGGGLVGGMLGGRAGVGAVRGQRAAVAQRFYEDQGFAQKDIPGHIKGINLDRPVSVATIPKDTPVTQYQVPGGRQGNYYAPPGTPASKLGISPEGVSRTTGAVVNKTPLTYTTTRDVQVLRSTAASVDDTWSVPGTTYRAEGGGTQYFVTDKGAFAP